MRHNWTTEEIIEIYNRPLLQLVYEAASVHRQHHDPSKVQVSSLISIKTGGCPEDCSYCPQSVQHNTKLKVHNLMELGEVVELAGNAKKNGASRVCMGAAWRNVRDNKDFDKVLDMVRGVSSLDMEVCCTLGMLTEDQAEKLAQAGLYAYNHNLDTSEEFYGDIISTRTYEDRLKTLKNVHNAKLVVCSGGIIGMGESIGDRAGMLKSLANLSEHPGSVPINALVPVEGTPLEEQKIVSIWEMVRMIATTRLVMPHTVIRLSAGRTQMSLEGQALCFLAGAGSIFAGDKLLTTPNPDINEDLEMFKIFGLEPTAPYENVRKETSVA
jgi:biotin synthase